MVPKTGNLTLSEKLLLQIRPLAHENRVICGVSMCISMPLPSIDQNMTNLLYENSLEIRYSSV